MRFGELLKTIVEHSSSLVVHMHRRKPREDHYCHTWGSLYVKDVAGRNYEEMMTKAERCEEWRTAASEFSDCSPRKEVHTATNILMSFLTHQSKPK